MAEILNILTGIGGGFIGLWALLWTYIRFQRIVHNREANRQIKNFWWLLLLLGFSFLVAALAVFMANK